MRPESWKTMGRPLLDLGWGCKIAEDYMLWAHNWSRAPPNVPTHLHLWPVCSRSKKKQNTVLWSQAEKPSFPCSVTPAPSFGKVPCTYNEGKVLQEFSPSQSRYWSVILELIGNKLMTGTIPFFRLRKFSSISRFLKVLFNEWVLNFIKWYFYTYWRNHMVFLYCEYNQLC